MKYVKQFICFLLGTGIIIFLVNSCAVQADPLGGPADVTPPMPDSLASSPNNQLFFEKQDIKLVFNEWVTLKNENQIIVSPPLEHGLKVKLKKRHSS